MNTILDAHIEGDRLDYKSEKLISLLVPYE